MTLYRGEYACERDCGYQAAVANAVWTAFKRAIPDECPRCGADITTCGGEPA